MSYVRKSVDDIKTKLIALLKADANISSVFKSIDENIYYPITPKFLDGLGSDSILIDIEGDYNYGSKSPMILNNKVNIGVYIFIKNNISKLKVTLWTDYIDKVAEAIAKNPAYQIVNRERIISTDTHSLYRIKLEAS